MVVLCLWRIKSCLGDCLGLYLHRKAAGPPAHDTRGDGVKTRAEKIQSLYALEGSLQTHVPGNHRVLLLWLDIVAVSQLDPPVLFAQL